MQNSMIFASLHFRFRQVLSWWLMELQSLVPVTLMRFLRRREEKLIAYVDDREISLTLQERRGARPLGAIPLNRITETAGRKPDQAAGLVATMLPDPVLQRRFVSGALPVELRLPLGKALQTSMAFPAAAEPDLRQIIALQLDRRTPFTAESGCFSWRVTSRDGRQLCVAVTVVSRTIIAAALRLLSSLGMNANGITLADASDNQAACGNLMPELEAPRPRRLARHVAAALGAAGLVFGLFWLQYDAARTVSDLRQELTAVKRIAQQAEKVAEEIATEGESGHFLSAKKSERPRASILLDELSRIIPDNTWLVQLTLKGDQIDIVGYSSSAAALVPAISQSDLLAEPRFRSAVQSEASVGRERFELTIGLEGEKRP